MWSEDLYDDEDWAWMTDPAFWQMLAAQRQRGRTLNQAEVDALLTHILQGISQPTTTFMAEYRAGLVSAEAIDDWVDAWHDGVTDLPMHAYLGFTIEQYWHWVQTAELPTRDVDETGAAES